MRVLIGIPTGLYNPLAETMQHLLNYWLLNPPVPVTVWLEISNRVDVNRSRLILKQAREGYDVQVMMDSDILVDTPFREVMRIYKDAMEAEKELRYNRDLRTLIAMSASENVKL